MAYYDMTSGIPPGFTGLLMDRADHLRLAGDRIGELASQAEARLMAFAGLDPLLDEDGRLAWHPATEQQDPAALIFLGLQNEVPLFAPLAPPESAESRPNTFFLLASMDAEDVALWGMARSLINWHARHGFCGNCGAPTIAFRAGWGRRCDNCSSEHFPRIDPVVIMLAEHDGRVLVGRQGRFPPRSFSALAGYIEPGESIEEAVARELKEEAGVTVSNVRYLVSQHWPFSGALMLACLADAEADELTLDPTELEDAMWVDRPGVAAALAYEDGAPFVPPPHYAIAHSLLRLWLESR